MGVFNWTSFGLHKVWDRFPIFYDQNFAFVYEHSFALGPARIRRAINRFYSKRSKIVVPPVIVVHQLHLAQEMPDDREELYATCYHLYRVCLETYRRVQATYLGEYMRERKFIFVATCVNCELLEMDDKEMRDLCVQFVPATLRLRFWCHC